MTAPRPLPGGAAIAEVPAAPSLARVARGDLCAGCGACAALAPGRVAMAMRAPGYLRPWQQAPLSAAEDAAIAAVCPGLGQRVRAGGRADHPLWGPWREMRTGWATDPELRHAGSSGGGLSALLLHLIEEGTVAGALVTVPDPWVPVRNAVRVVADRAGILAAAGSRYAPSAPLAAVPEAVAAGRPLAFVGKPCDAAALRAMAARDPAVARTFPVVLSFFCAGVPSEAGAREILAALGVAAGEVAAFRYRGHGWPGRATARLADGAERSMSYHESWGRILTRHVQHRCKVCADGTGAAADIVCADPWETDAAGYPLFAEAPGRSLFVARTELGQALLHAAAAAGRIETRPFEVDGLAALQPGQRTRKAAVPARLAALALLGRPRPRYRGLRLGAAARTAPPRRHLRNFAGMLRRALGLRTAPFTRPPEAG